MDPLSDAKILQAWQCNAAPWTRAVRTQAIESRRLVTDAAVVQTVLACKPRHVLDVGCGEGWLARALAGHGIAVTGIDAVAALIDSARAQATACGSACRFEVARYEDIAAGTWSAPQAAPVDTVACNFSLIGDAAVGRMLAALAARLPAGTALVIQTLHPAMVDGQAPYRDGWRPGSWAGFDDDFVDPPPWYFRTMAGWVDLLHTSGWRLQSLTEPLHPLTGRPASVLFTARSREMA